MAEACLKRIAQDQAGLSVAVSSIDASTPSVVMPQARQLKTVISVTKLHLSTYVICSVTRKPNRKTVGSITAEPSLIPDHLFRQKRPSICRLHGIHPLYISFHLNWPCRTTC